MAISQKELQEILAELPESQRQSAMRRVLHADAAGWTRIGIWVWFCTRKHEADLVGLNSKGEFKFLFYQNAPGER